MKIILTIGILLFFLNITLNAQKTVEINVDATKTIGELEPFWASQIIHPAEFLLTDWGKDLLNLMEETGAARQYIRIYNQPQYAIRVTEDGSISYDWSRFDKMADLILSTKNRLKVVFMGMPIELALYPGSVHKRHYGTELCTSPPKDYRQWEELCADFTRHVISKYGIDEVRQWTFRCWNEPDLGYWMNYDLSEYLKLYDFFAQGVKSVTSEIMIGGPALSTTKTYQHPENFKLFLDHVAKGTNHATGKVGSPIDFLSVHAYGGTNSGGGIGRESPDVDYLTEQLIRYADMRDEYPMLKGLPIHVEEWGVSAGGSFEGIKPHADIRNSQYGAAFLTTLVNRYLELKLEDRKIENFTFCASGYERTLFRDFMGFRTLHTKSGFHKPILNAYKFLYKMAPDLVQVNTNEKNENISALATRDDKRITILITNYQPKYIYNAGQEYLIKVCVNQDWGSETDVTIKHWRIDESHSNAFSAFKEIGSPEFPNPMQIDAVKKRMDLELLEPEKQMPSRGMSNIEFNLPCSGVSLIEITRD